MALRTTVALALLAVVALAGAPQLASAAPTVTKAKFTFVGGGFGPYALDIDTRGFGYREMHVCVSGHCVNAGAPSRHQSFAESFFGQTWGRGQSRVVRINACTPRCRKVFLRRLRLR
jgi:hypothetical protein